MIVILSCIVVGVNAETFKGLYNKSTYYSPEWKNLDTRPLPQWYDSAKIGILVHWGVYSVPCFKGEWFWYYLQKGKYYKIQYAVSCMYPYLTLLHTYYLLLGVNRSE